MRRASMKIKISSGKSLMAGRNMQKVFKQNTHTHTHTTTPHFYRQMPGPRFYKIPLSSCCGWRLQTTADAGPTWQNGQMPALCGRMGRCQPYVAWASHVEAKPIPHRNMKRSPHHAGPASAHSTEGLASADESEGSWRGHPGGIFIAFNFDPNIKRYVFVRIGPKLRTETMVWFRKVASRISRRCSDASVSSSEYER